VVVDRAAMARSSGTISSSSVLVARGIPHAVPLCADPQ
jgi:hypothetical protein